MTERDVELVANLVKNKRRWIRIYKDQEDALIQLYRADVVELENLNGFLWARLSKK